MIGHGRRTVYILLVIVCTSALGQFVYAEDVSVSVSHKPEDPTYLDNITIEALIVNITNVGQVILWYNTCTGSMCGIPKQIHMERSGERYVATIGPFDKDTERVEYKVLVYAPNGTLIYEGNMITVDLSVPIKDNAPQQPQGNESGGNGGKEGGFIPFISPEYMATALILSIVLGYIIKDWKGKKR